MVDDVGQGEAHWPLRIWVLALLGGAIALSIERLDAFSGPVGEWTRLLRTASIFLGTAGLAFGLAWIRGRLPGAVVVALLCGLIAGGVMLWTTRRTIIRAISPGSSCAASRR